MAVAQVTFSSNLSSDITIAAGSTYHFTVSAASGNPAAPIGSVKCNVKVGTVYAPYNRIGSGNRREQVVLNGHQNVQPITGPITIQWSGKDVTGSYYVEQNS